ncbi:spermine oxidase-like [Aedes albopictus]|uniref:Amine oxidase domain-containing protein n=1 Tax=Aedes albopictus TaxID=7160 RepID=A0ABM1Z533_AEDAL|nr:spermine oxidase-like [Aedes albopictus]
MSPKILIIGAGASGIAAATRLYDSGFRNLIILEAENRLGGRIHTVPYGENVLDYGAQWVHSSVDNVVYDMAAKYDLVEVERHREDELCIKSNGEEVPIEVSNRVMDVLEHSIDDEENVKQYKKSLGDYYTESFQKALRDGQFADIDYETCYQIFQFFLKYHHTYNAVDSVFEMSAAGLLEFTDHQDEYLINWRTRGFKTILDLLMKRLPQQNAVPIPIEDYVFFNKRVVNISYSSDVKQSVRVTCRDGSCYIVDHVIVTVSLGVLKEMHQTLFTPSLPQLKRNAIEGLYIGVVDKMVLQFDKPFWPEGWRGFAMLWNEQDLSELRKSDKSWLEGVASFFVPEYQPNLLVGWVHGKDARTMENLPESKVVEALLFVLRKFLVRFDIPQPKSFTRSTWYSNENFRGSYSSRSMKSDALNAKASDLAQPLVNSQHLPVVQFAGEATHPEYFSTVQGAVESGWREADRLIEVYKDKPRTVSKL